MSGLTQRVVVVAVFVPAWSVAVRADDPPLLATYPCQTGITWVPFAGVAPRLSNGTPPVYWSAFEAPAGMLIDPLTGQVFWEQPLEGVYRITLCATNSSGQDYAEWILRVVRNDFTGPQMYSTSHMDFVAPGLFIQWMRDRKVKRYVDGCWEYMRDVFGHEPLDGKQVFRYTTGWQSTAGGNPAESTPDNWSTDPVLGWGLGNWLHGVSYNFLARTRISRIISSNWAERYFDSGSEMTAILVENRVLLDPDSFGLSGERLAKYGQWVQARQAADEGRCQEYIAWLGQGGTAETYYGDCTGVWNWICRLLQDQYGPGVLENTLRALRIDGLPETTYELIFGSTPVRKNTLLFCIMSAAAGQDLRSFFEAWGWQVDHSFFDLLYPSISQIVLSLPTTEDDRGWKRSSVNGHYYRLTGWSMEWGEAERSARRMGGHLVTLRSSTEEQWVISRLGFEANLWSGLHDMHQEGNWTWISGEPLVYTRWGIGEPNGGISENAMLFYSWEGDKKWWIDTSAYNRFLGVMERGALPILVRPDWDKDDDVDEDDMELLDACITGPAIPAALGCVSRDVDGDGDVDQDDFGIAQRCFSGAGAPANPFCDD